jgi:AcrR family transcriptional regulator
VARPRDETKEGAILDATLHEIARNGLARLSIDAVAKRAGIGSGTVYVYFEGKDALVDALYAKVKAEFSALIFADDGAPVRVGVERASIAYLEYCVTRLDELVFLDQMELQPQQSERVLVATRKAMRPLHDLLERGKAEHLVKPLATDLLLAFLSGALRGMARAIAHEPRARRAERAREVAALCWHAIAA